MGRDVVNEQEAPAPVASAIDPPEVHVVSTWESVRAALARRAPRALCGEVLAQDMDRPEPHAGSPMCPVCSEMNGGDPR